MMTEPAQFAGSGESYTVSVTRFLLTLLFVSLLFPAFSQQQQQPAVQEPPEEDVSPREKTEYVLNPLQAVKELKIGNYYYKKGSFRAAARRFEEATKWDPNSAEAWFRLGEAQFKLRDEKAGRDAWQKYLDLEPDGKNAETVKKRLSAKS